MTLGVTVKLGLGITGLATTPTRLDDVCIRPAAPKSVTGMENLDSNILVCRGLGEESEF